MVLPVRRKLPQFDARARAALRKDLSFAATIARSAPLQCLVQITNRCNMQCSFCDFWPNVAPRSEELTVSDYTRVSGELAGLGTAVISIEGGEPLLRKDLVGIVGAFGKHHIPMLFTNGWHVTEDMARALWDAGLVHAGVSIDYPDSERHDRKRGLQGATERAWRAVETFRRTAPNGGKQVFVMTVLMESNWQDMEALLRKSEAAGVGHQTTLLSTGGFRRGKEGPDSLPPPEAGPSMVKLWERYRHLRYFHDYFATMEPFLRGGPMPTCEAGVQSFNIDHVGNVSPCIEKIDSVVGNVKKEPLGVLHRRLVDAASELSGCQDCWTACRGLAQALGRRGSVSTLRDLATRMRPA